MRFVKQFLLKLRGKPKSLDEKIKHTEQQLKRINRYSTIFHLCLLVVFICSVFILRDIAIALKYGQIETIEFLVVANLIITVLLYALGSSRALHLFTSDVEIENLRYRLEKMEQDKTDGGA